MTYQEKASLELSMWKCRMEKPPGFAENVAKKIQVRINSLIPEKIHNAFTTAIKQMTRAVIFGATFTTAKVVNDRTLEQRELRVLERIKFYRNTAAAEGAVTGAGGILLGLADFPIWLALKMKMLFEIASLYGYDVRNLKERIYILYIFELTFSSQSHRNSVFELINDWEKYEKRLPEDIHGFDWLKFQQEYRDYIDIAKLLQLVPGIGAAVGAVVNHKLTDKLGTTAMNAYRIRLMQEVK
ncbi:EcsC family protein [Fulvivirgaceae bacterium PWU20]|uniref:EcsC family protein n=2 Tax=Chryseosolibacter indicus TaxID=2782351 RepID=A0ABS5VK06_9BACT|nr:EcsC family protein [Chryseosolibacter indicus]